ncbi:hypothetical protein IMAU30003_01512 [Lactobacillus helveticus]|uniref:Uncharacterized protein n=1 Tax=Lactobacillus helveticus TaxID=1587 RepID=A0A9Q5C572_LACHE|nr:hypothetical protein [Lactobacillus helveticus]
MKQEQPNFTRCIKQTSFFSIRDYDSKCTNKSNF